MTSVARHTELGQFGDARYSNDLLARDSTSGRGLVTFFSGYSAECLRKNARFYCGEKHFHVGCQSLCPARDHCHLSIPRQLACMSTHSEGEFLICCIKKDQRTLDSSNRYCSFLSTGRYCTVVPRVYQVNNLSEIAASQIESVLESPTSKGRGIIRGSPQ